MSIHRVAVGCCPKWKEEKPKPMSIYSRAKQRCFCLFPFPGYVVEACTAITGTKLSISFGMASAVPNSLHAYWTKEQICSPCHTPPLWKVYNLILSRTRLLARKQVLPLFGINFRWNKCIYTSTWNAYCLWLQIDDETVTRVVELKEQQQNLFHAGFDNLVVYHTHTQINKEKL